MKPQRAPIFFLVALLALSPLTIISAHTAAVDASSSELSWRIDGAHGGAVLTLKGEAGVERHEFAAGTEPRLRLPVADGIYTWELSIAPVLTEAQQADRARAREGSDPGIVLPKGTVTSGVFTISGGFVIEKQAASGDRDFPTQNLVVNDDLHVRDSACIGFDCVEPESFGSDTIRLKEHSLRIKFEDTSVGSFPSTDWQLTANDSASGGANKFSVDDITAGTVPLTIEGAARTNSLFVDSTGRVGFGTATPVLSLHVASGDGPGLRLEQTNASGFTPQTWDLGGNEANFFVRDVTNSSRLPFRIRPGAPTSSIDIQADGDVGIGTATPDGPLHIRRNNATSRFTIEELSNDPNNQIMLRLIKWVGGIPVLRYISQFRTWDFSAGNFFTVNDPFSPNIEMSLTEAGDLTIEGVMTAVSFDMGSDVHSKENFGAVDAQAILRKVTSLPISTWNFKADKANRYIGPMSQDFFAAFDLGTNEKVISATNINGVALAAIQGLNLELEQRLQQKDQELNDLRARLTALEARVPAQVP